MRYNSAPVDYALSVFYFIIYSDALYRELLHDRVIWQTFVIPTGLTVAVNSEQS